MEDHAAIARMIGPIKFSLHSARTSFPFTRLWRGRRKVCFHVKTAGTSYLEALRVSPDSRRRRCFAEIVDFARGRYERTARRITSQRRFRSVPPRLELVRRRRRSWSGCTSSNVAGGPAEAGAFYPARPARFFMYVRLGAYAPKPSSRD